MTRLEVKLVLGQFLAQHRALNSFECNLQNNSYFEKHNVKSVCELVNFVDKNPHLLLVLSFNWEETKEGKDFWSTLSQKWYNECMDRGWVGKTFSK